MKNSMAERVTPLPREGSIVIFFIPSVSRAGEERDSLLLAETKGRRIACRCESVTRKKEA